jgi:leader peptidase (prepilin peptidase) / N-methyltransferase
MPIALTAVFGAMIGSFLNVVAYRLPRRESLVTPGSHCPGCDTPIKFYDNVPVLGWLMLRGRCRNCHVSISPRYPIVEAVTAALAVAVLLVANSTRDVALGLVLVGILVPVALIDLDHRIIPNKITAPAAYPRGMGMGDVKLAGVLGLFLGREVAVAILVALIAGTVLGAAVIARLGVERGRKTAVPFGPFLALGGVVALLAGAPIVHWYLHLHGIA